MGNFNKIVLDEETLEVEDTKARTDIGELSSLQTTTKDNLVKAVNECFRSASDGKALIASAITGKGVNTDSGATYAAMAENISSIQVGIDTSDATATAGQMLSGSTAYVKGEKVTGTLPNYAGKNFGHVMSETYEDDGTPVTRLSLANYVAIKRNSIGMGMIRIKLGTVGAVDWDTFVDVPISGFSAANIRSDVFIGSFDSKIGITGTFTSDGTAVATDILAGKIAYVKGQRITGSIKTLDGIYSGKVDVDNQGNEVPRLSNSNIKRIVRTTAKDGGSVLYNYQIGTTEAGYIPNNSTVYVALQGLVPESIKYGQKVGNPDGTAEQYIEGTYTSDATATAAQILAGQIAYVKGTKITGTMPNITGVKRAWCGFENVTVQAHPSSQGQGQVTVPNAYNILGYYDSTSSVTANIANLSAENIKAGVLVGRYGGDSTNCITGTYTSDATATEAQILAGQIAYAKGSKLTGTMANNGAVNQSLAVNGTYTIPVGYHNGSGKVTQSLTTKAAATYTPGDTAQTIAAGQYLNGVQTISAVPTETKTVTAGTAATTVNRTSGKYMTAVTVNPTPSQTKTVTMTSSPLTVLPDAGYLLSGVTVNADLGKKFATGTITGYTNATYKSFNVYYYGEAKSEICRYFVLNCGFVPSVIVFTASFPEITGYFRGVVSNNTPYVRNSVSYNGLVVENGYTPVNYVTTIGTSTEVAICTSFNTTTVDITWFAFG
jgi:hypothetical protein